MAIITGNTYPVKEQLRALGGKWDAARKGWIVPDDREAEARALVQPHPLYNSPPPADLGTAGPEELAAKFGRKAVPGAKVVSFEVRGLPKGEDGDPDGTIHGSRGKRYLQVARTARRYYSRDFLEDCDEFGAEPGGGYQWDGVEVEPTEAEAVADRAEAEAKDVRKRAVDTLRTLAEEVHQGEHPEGDAARLPSGVGTETIHADRSGRQKFILGDGWIWLTTENGADGNDWSYNNLSGRIGRRMPFDEAKAEAIREAARLLGHERRVEKGEPPRKEITTAYGRVWALCSAFDTPSVLIDWTPSEPIHGHAKLTYGTPQTVEGQPVVGFREEFKEGRGRRRIAARIAGRHELAELVSLRAELLAEVQAHYGEED